MTGGPCGCVRRMGVHHAEQLGTPVPIAPADIDALFDRYQNIYGQAPDGPPMKGTT